MIFIKKLIRKILGRAPSVEELRAKGAVIGKNCHVLGAIDGGHTFLVSMGNNVTVAGGARILTHLPKR